MTQSRSYLADKEQMDLNGEKMLKQTKIQERSKSQSSDFHGNYLGDSRLPQ
jgi:hypothetical protein